MKYASIRRFVTALVIVAATTCGLAAQSAAQNAADAAWLIQALEIKAGSTVGEIGAGDGEISFAVVSPRSARLRRRAASTT